MKSEATITLPRDPATLRGGTRRDAFLVTVDAIAFRWFDEGLYVALVKRKYAPFKGRWSLPGGHLDHGETGPVGALRELREETGLDLDETDWLVGAYTDPARDPRGFYVGLTYAIIVPDPDDAPLPELTGADDATEARWWPVKKLPKLAFDHADMIRDAREQYGA